MSGKKLSFAVISALLAALVAPGLASAAPTLEGVSSDLAARTTELNMVWVAVACVLVIFMQAGFMFLEIGFSRMKNAGAGVMKIFVNLAICTIAWWVVGAGISGFGNDLIGTSGYFYHFGQMVNVGDGTQVAVTSDSVMLMLYGFAFCAVSLAIVWGTTLERIKFGVYVIYAAIFGAVIYPMVAHSVWGGGLLSDVGGKPVMDFAGSSVVHLTGAVGGLAALLLLGARKGKYGPDGAPRAIPGHSMPLVGLGVMILWIGWFGFNGGSTFGADSSFFGEVMLNTQIGAATGVIGAVFVTWLMTKSLDVGMAGNGAIAGLVAHGMAGIWGTLAVGLFASPRLIVDGAAPGVWYGLFGDANLSSTFGQLGVQALAVVATFVFVFITSYAIVAIIKATMGLRVTEAEEDAGLDIANHGMYGYPEAFIPQPEFAYGDYTPSMAGTPVAPLEPATTEQV